MSAFQLQYIYCLECWCLVSFTAWLSCWKRLQEGPAKIYQRGAITNFPEICSLRTNIFQDLNLHLFISYHYLALQETYCFPTEEKKSLWYMTWFDFHIIHTSPATMLNLQKNCSRRILVIIYLATFSTCPQQPNTETLLSISKSYPISTFCILRKRGEWERQRRIFIHSDSEAGTYIRIEVWSSGAFSVTYSNFKGQVYNSSQPSQFRVGVDLLGIGYSLTTECCSYKWIGVAELGLQCHVTNV